MYINREIGTLLEDKLRKTNKITIIYGARQTGKTTVAKKIVKNLKLKTLYVNAELSKYQELFSNLSLTNFKSILAGYKMLYIDEAQYINNIGTALKIIYDEMKDIKIIVTGSSSLDIANKISEPLTGRKFAISLLPFSLSEIKNNTDIIKLKEIVNKTLIFGLYPEVFTQTDEEEKIDLLSEIAESYLFKDIFMLTSIKNPLKLRKLLQLLAYQVGSTVSINELSNELSLNFDTVERYIELLEKSFVIFRLSSFSTNLRNQIKKQDKFYFYDLGIRNVIIDDFRPLHIRNDVGQLWENFVIMERLKISNNNKLRTQFHFWRTYNGSEIDLIEQKRTKIYAFEIKYKKERKSPPKLWGNIYPESTFNSISINNFHEHLL